MTTETYPFQNPELPISERVSDLVSRLTGESRPVSFELDAARLSCFDDAGRERIFPGEFQLMVSRGFPGQDAYGNSGVSKYSLPLLSGSFRIQPV